MPGSEVLSDCDPFTAVRSFVHRIWAPERHEMLSQRRGPIVRQRRGILAGLCYTSPGGHRVRATSTTSKERVQGAHRYAESYARPVREGVVVIKPFRGGWRALRPRECP